MGVEYRHYLVVNDANWLPQPDTMSRVGAVLSKWSLGEHPLQAIDLSSGQNREIEIDAASVNPGAGVAFVYAGVEGDPIGRIAGPSLYDNVPATWRYTMKTTLVVGHDYRVQWSSESIYFEVAVPPSAGGKPIKENDDEDPFDILFAESFPSIGATSPPIVKVHIEEHAEHNIGWSDYQGFWRGALVIDFGKDLPRFVKEVHELPAREFVTAIGEAFRGPIVEIGEFY